MSLKDLENAGVTLPTDQWGRQTVRSKVSRPGFLLSGSGALAATALMFVGDGGTITWIAALMFLVSLFFVTAIVFRAVATDRESASDGGSA